MRSASFTVLYHVDRLIEMNDSAFQAVEVIYLLLRYKVLKEAARQSVLLLIGSEEKLLIEFSILLVGYLAESLDVKSHITVSISSHEFLIVDKQL